MAEVLACEVEEVSSQTDVEMSADVTGDAWIVVGVLNNTAELEVPLLSIWVLVDFPLVDSTSKVLGDGTVTNDVTLCVTVLEVC